MSQAAHQQYNSTQYDRIRALGKGSFGTATVHRRRTDCSLVVLKEIDLQRFKGEREKLAAVNEARIMSTLNHLNIIKYHNAYITDTKLIIEMEYASVGTLAAYLTFQAQPLEEREILVIFRQIANGLHYLHSRDIVHLDLKMTNIFVTIEGLVKIGDFGISQYMSGRSSAGGQLGQLQARTGARDRSGGMPPTSSSHMLGTLAYSSPERCLGEPTDFKSDIWSMGCILYELITSRPLFSGTCLPDLVLAITRIQYSPIRRQIMPALRDTFEQTIARQPQDRPTAKELLYISGQLLASKVSQANHRQTAKIKKSHNRVELSTEVALLGQQAAHTGSAHQPHQPAPEEHLNYLHSLVYQVRLDLEHIRVNRVNLPQTKRIKELCKGKSHYLVLTYDNIVYGWGSKSHGQLGACGLSSSSHQHQSSTGAAGLRATRSARSSINAKDLIIHHSGTSLTAASSPASSTQTLAAAPTLAPSSAPTKTTTTTSSSSHHLSRQLVMSMLAESPPTSRPFILNELNHRKIVQVAAGNNFSVFLSRTGIVMTCGDGARGCLGNGDLGSCFTPRMVESLLNADVVSVACGPEHVVAVCGDGRAFAWGNSGHGRLGVALRASPCSNKEGNRRGAGKFVLRPEPVVFTASRGGVLVERAFCGDRCTVFIDSENRCWACGENRFNKLGLDLKRRFKKDLIVDKCLYPTEVSQLSKYKVATCSIGRNHSTFITTDGKLLVFGQDIDHSYRLRNNIISSRESHRRITSELLGGPIPAQAPPFSRPQHRHLPRRAHEKFHLHAHQAPTTTTSKRDLITGSSQLLHQVSGVFSSHKRSRLGKLQRQQLESYVKKSRSTRKMPFDSTISVGCRPRFTLALTNDNRVYFWGVRSHRKDDESTDGETGETKSSGGSRSRNRLDVSMEHQLVGSSSDADCFIKIGATNNSLMSSIESLGSDQPIIHAQDPRLRAKSLADLWILDYRPSSARRRSSSSGSISSNGHPESVESSSSSSCCSTCTNGCPAINVNCESGQNPMPHPGTNLDDCMRHDAILEPQPIVSLYVPSMFNHSGCSLNLVDLFCFDDNRFYLILDTSVKLQQGHPGSSRPPSSLQSPNASTSRKRLMSMTETARCQISKQLNAAESLSLANLHQASDGQALRAHQDLLAMGSGLQVDSIGELKQASERDKSSTLTELAIEQQRGSKLELSHQHSEDEVAIKNEISADQQMVEACGTQMVEELAREDKVDSCDDENNNHSTSSHNITNDHTLVSTSHGGVSMDEPRSLSTFAVSLGSHIIVGPTMRSARDHPLQPLTFRHGALSGEVHLELRTSESSDGDELARRLRDESLDEGGANLTVKPSDNRRLRVGRRWRANRSESMTNCTSNDYEETSSMPSWVRNEYIEHQHHQCHNDNNSEDNPEADIIGGEFPTVEANNNTYASGRIEGHSDAENTATNVSPDDDDESEQTLGHEISSIAGSYEVGNTDGEELVVEENHYTNFGGDNQQVSAPLPTAINLSVINLAANEIAEFSLADGNNETIAQMDQPDRRTLVISLSHPNISELAVKRQSELIFRRASILDDKQNETSNGQINNILDCDVYRAINVHSKVQQSESNSISHNNDTYIYNSNASNQHQLLQLSNNLLDSNLSSRCNSHNPLIRPDLGQNSTITTGYSNFTHSESQLHTGPNSYSESPYFWQSRIGEDPLEPALNCTFDSIDSNKPAEGKILVKESASQVSSLKGRLSRRQSLTTEQLNKVGKANKPSQMNKTRAASNSSLASLRKSLVKLFC